MKQIPLTVDQATSIGKKIAEVFKLKRDAQNKDRYQSTWGNKTTRGIGRTVVRIIEEQAAEPEQSDYDIREFIAAALELDEYQRKQIAMAMIASTLTDMEVEEIYRIIQPLFVHP